jgi:hypothetical protein
VKSLFLLALTCLCLSAQTVTFAIHDNTGATPDTPLPAAYQFPSTPQGSSSNIMLKATNNSSRTIQVVLPYVGGAAGSSISNPNYSVTNIAAYQILAPSASVYFSVNFTPSTTGQLLGYMQITYLVQQNGCVFAGASSGTPCSGFTDAVSTLEGTGTSPQFLLTMTRDRDRLLYSRMRNRDLILGAFPPAAVLRLHLL